MPVSQTGVLLSRPAPAGYVRALRNPLYDTDDIQNAATNQMRFFQVPQGQANLSGAVKSEKDTNLTIGGQLANPQMFDMFGFQFEVQCNSLRADKILVYNTGVAEFSFGTTRVWLQQPVTRIPAGPQLVTTATATTVGATTIQDTIFGSASVKEYLPFVKPNGAPYRIKATETFQMRLFWPSGAVTPSARCQLRFFVVGLHYVGL